MIKNYLNIAVKNIKKHRMFSVVSITGLTIGLAAFWIIGLYITNELSYDHYNPNADRIYRVVHYADWKGGSFKLAPTGVPFGPALKADYPEVEDYARFDAEGGGEITVGDKKIKANDILFTDNAALKIFGYHFLYGNAANALAQPQSIVLTKTLAEKLFGNADGALGKNVYFDKTYPNRVTGVIDDVPANTHFTFSALRSFNANYTDSWANFYVYTYIILKKGADGKKLQAQLGQFYKQHLEAVMGKNVNYHITLQPVTSIHLHSDYDYEMSANSSIKYVYIFSVIALLVLVIAVINYVNLSTARASVRVKEIGIRKVVGSGKKQLIAMFLTESLVLTFIAALLAAALTNITLPYFNTLAGLTLSMWQFGIANTVAALLLFALVTGLLSGLYPAFFLSKFRAVPALKGETGKQGSSVFFRKALVTFQFVITITLVAGTGVIYQQMQFALHKDLGFNKNAVLSFHIANHNVRNQLPALKQQLLQSPLIEAVAAASNPIGNNDIGTNSFYFEQETNNPAQTGAVATTATAAENFMADADYLPTLQIKLLKGRNFSASTPTDTISAVLVNETLVKQLRWKNAVGKKVDYNIGNGQTIHATVIGVMKDFNSYSLQHKIQALVLRMPPVAKEEDNLYVRISSKNIPAAISYLKQTYKKFDADNDVDYTFLDENFARQYNAEQRQGNIIFTFTLLAILISCLGLLGLVTFAASQRTKEIGIRKVLGATVSNIVFMLSKDLLKLVLLAILVATPLAWYATHKWLESFAYRVNIGWSVFALAGAVALLVALLTTGIKAVTAALANPVKSLRTE
ncbi:MAG TPA: ABC transporter permease [Chitinophagaceae bacterium]|nr:ABC transporter permease [Chitinophagaceae bacterium]